MPFLFFRIYLKRITKLALFLHVVMTISFAFLQMPHFLEIVRGIKFSLSDIFMILAYKTVEWINAILTISFCAICFYIIYVDLKRSNLEMLLLQLGHAKKYLINVLIFLGCIYSVLFFVIDGFVAPYVNYELKNILLRISKEKFVSSLVPFHIIPFQEWSLALGKRSSDYKIENLIIDKEAVHEKDASVTFFVKEASFYNQDYMSLNLKKGIGKLEFADIKMNFKFKKGRIDAPSSLIRLQKLDKDKDITELTSLFEIIKRFRLAVVGLIMPFWIFIMFFSITLVKIFAALSFVLLFFSAIDVITFNLFLFIIYGLAIVFIYKRITKDAL